MKTIDRFSGAYAVLSNFYPSVVRLDGVEYPSVEHAYQAAKTFNLREREGIRRAPKPGTAKALGRMVRLRVDWEDVKLKVMKDLVRQKFQGAKAQAMLMATGDAVLIEGNYWNDTFWGICNGKGENHLGRILMEVRAEIRRERARDPSSPRVLDDDDLTEICGW